MGGQGGVVAGRFGVRLRQYLGTVVGGLGDFYVETIPAALPLRQL